MIVILLVADVGFLLAGSVQYMYSKDRFDWEAPTFSNYKAALNLIRAGGILGGDCIIRSNPATRT